MAARAAEHPFLTVARWFEGLGELRQEFGGGTGPFAARLVAEAEDAARERYGLWISSPVTRMLCCAI